MRKKDLIKQLHKVKDQVQPDAVWKSSNREILLNQIKAQSSLDFSQKKFKILANISPNKMFLAFARPVVSMAVILLAILGLYTASVSATKNSLPGDLFYNVKLTSERVQVNLTLNDAKKVNLEIVFAGRRLDEIKKISDTNANNDVTISLMKFKENMVNVKGNLAKLEKNDKESAIKMANMIDSKTQEYVVTLESQTSGNTDTNLETEKAIFASKSTGNKAVSLIINEYESDPGDVSSDELVAKVSFKITDLKNDLNSAKSDIDTIITNQEDEIKRIEAEAQAAVEAAEAQAVVEALAELDAEAEIEAAEAAEEEEVIEEEAISTEDSEEVVNEETTTDEGSETNEELEESNEEVLDDSSDQELVEEVVVEPEVFEDEEPIIAQEPEEVLPTIEEINNKRIKALAFLVDADILLSEGKISEAFNKVKQAEEILSIVNRVILANADYLFAEEAGENTDESEVIIEESDEAVMSEETDEPEL